MQTRVDIDILQLRSAIQSEYTDVATVPMKGFHFHTGRFLADRLGYPAERVRRLPDSAVDSFAGVGNPSVGENLRPVKRCSISAPEQVSISCRPRLWSVLRAVRLASI